MKDMGETALSLPAQKSDAETGLYYYGARYYDPTAGRFVGEDPEEFGGGATNFYKYASENPTNLADPFGWSPKGDKWYGHNDRDFQRWFHRCWKLPGEPDADKSGIEEAFREWVSRGRPRNGKCHKGDEPDPPIGCPQKDPKWKPVPIPYLGPMLDYITDPMLDWIGGVWDDLKHVYPPKPRPIFGPGPIWWPVYDY
jgi:RHS repeat-associated protein